MGLLNVSVDDLLGYSKLQDLLLLIVSRVNEQDEALQKFQGLEQGLSAASTRLSEQMQASGGATEKLRAEMAELAEAQAAQKLRLVAVEDKMEQHVEHNPKEMMSEVAELRMRVDAMAQQLSSLNSQAAPSEKLRELSAAWTQTEERMMALAKSNLSANEELERLKQKVDSMSEALKITEAQLKIGVQVHSLGEIRASLGELRVDADAARQHSSRLESQLSDLLESKADLARSTDSAMNDMRRELAARLARAEAAALETGPKGADLLPRIIALELCEQSERAERDDTAREMAKYKDMLENFFAKGSSTTTRCMSCFNRRYQEGNSHVVGTNGQIYQNGVDEKAAETKKPPVHTPSRPKSALQEFNGGLVLGQSLSKRPSTAARRWPSAAQSTSLIASQVQSSHAMSSSLPDLSHGQSCQTEASTADWPPHGWSTLLKPDLSTDSRANDSKTL